MNEQQQRMAAVETDKELSDLLDFSAVREWKSSVGGSGWAKSAIQVWVWGGRKMEVCRREVGKGQGKTFF